MSVQRMRPVEEGLHRHLVGGVEPGRGGAADPAGLVGQARGRGRRRGRAARSRGGRPSAQSMPAERAWPSRSGQARAYPMGRRMSGMRELGDGGAVGELDHRVDDRLRVDDHLDAVVADAEQLVGLDHLEALVHERRRVDGDLRAHLPGGVGQGLVDGDRRRARRGCGRGTGPPLAVSTIRCTRSGPAAAQRLQALVHRAVLAVDRHQLGAGGLPHPLRPPARRRSATPCWPAPGAGRRASVARVTRRPAKPTTPFTHTSASAPRLARPSSPTRSSQDGRAALSSSRWVPSATATTAGRRRAAWAASAATSRPLAPRATIRNRSGSASTTSRVWVPIEPVDPASATVVVRPPNGPSSKNTAA